jgi:DNA-binding FadR family transcriptional regulator
MPKSAGGNSARQRFISIIERRILSGELKVDQQLPPERELAEQTGISRITVHAGLVELASRGVLRVVPRQGTFVSDYKKEGTLELYSALLRYTGEMEADIFDSLIAFREIVETAAAEKAAQRRNPQDADTLRRLLKRERSAASTQEAAELDFQFHLAIARASGNIILPMTLRSIELMYMSLVTKFYEALDDRAVVYGFHEELITALENGDAQGARHTMKAMLDHGRRVLETRGRQA